MIRFGRFLFNWRNALFPAGYVLLFAKRSAPAECYAWAAWAGLAVALSGQALRFVTIGLDYIVRGGRDRQVYAENLVTGGLFAHCRNPLYVGNYLILVGVGIASCSVPFLGLALPFFTLAYWAITQAEEDYLRTKFGPVFDGYCAEVNRYVPRLSGLGATLSGAPFNWRRVIVKEYGTTFIWTAALVAVVLQNRSLVGIPVLAPASMDTVTVTLWGLVAVACFAYGAARFLKKSGRLKA